MADSTESTVQEHWGETNGKKYRRGSRLPKKTDTVPAAPAAETPKVPWKWEEDGMTVIRGTARSAPGCHNVCGILSYVKDGKLVKATPRTPTTRAVFAAVAFASPTTSTIKTAFCTR